MFTNKPTQNQQTNNSMFKVQTQDRLPTKQTTPLKANNVLGRNHHLKHTRNNSSMINQSIQIFQTITQGIFGGTQEKQAESAEKLLPGALTDGLIKNNEQDDSANNASILYCETEYNAFDNKMHPTKIVEKNWVDSYKLAQLIEQQEKWLDDSA